ncbi:MAG: hypothetical protein ACPKPY_13600 [Nitrososphaeraceae archaeon]
MFSSSTGNKKKKITKINLGVRQTVLERAKYKCQTCSKRFNNNEQPKFYHINGSLKDNSPANLKALCEKCFAGTGENKIKDSFSGKIRSLFKRVVE